ncbi:MAG: hypothetical protein KME16_24590 [Scytolyngbya sp. HA4215-MV1]|jgi:hypothetical protein|nr:hypothetical protein [Scytolyngbya sp. HA4215-MV1]
MSSSRNFAKRQSNRRRNLWFERIMATIASANLCLVMFDLTYVSWRNFWLQGNIPVPFTQFQVQVPLPEMDCNDRSITNKEPPRTLRQSVITCIYDPIKGIQPHRETQSYLNTVQTLERQINQKGLDNAFKSTEVQATLAKLRNLSSDMIVTDPFAAANKSGILEKIKNQMRDQVRSKDRENVPAREAFDIFWSTQSLTPATWEREKNWFDQKVAPLIATNYYRTIGENGDPTNNFWVLDAPFVILFALEFLARTFYISRRYSSLSWLDAMIWRWYDIPLLFPFGVTFPAWAWVRIFPVANRLDEAEIVDMHQIQDQVRHSFVANIAEEITEVVVVQVINQVQGSITRGEVTNWLMKSGDRRYIDINNRNEVEEITAHLIKLTVYQVFPKVQPDIEALLRHVIESVLKQSPLYRGFETIPGLGNIPSQINERVISEATQTAYTALRSALEDPVFTDLVNLLVKNLVTTLTTEVQQQNTVDELQGLLTDLLEEIKVNYVQRLAEEDVEALLEKTRQLHQQPKGEIVKR